jgi:hypothetical protein
MFNPIVDQELHRREDDESQDNAAGKKQRDIKAHMHDEVD